MRRIVFALVVLCVAFTSANAAYLNATLQDSRIQESNHIYKPDPENIEVYERSYKVFKKLYKSNALNFKGMNV